MRLPDGRMQVVTYQADEAGFRPKVTYETDPNFVPTTDSDSGYYEKPPEVYLLTERPKHYDYKKKKTVKYHRHRPSPTPKYKPSKYEYVTPLPLIEYAPEEVHHSPYEEPVVFVTPKSVPHGYPSPTPTPTPTPIPVLITTTSYEPPHKKYKPPVINYDPRKRQKIHKVKPLAPDAPPPLPPVTKPKYKPGLEVVHDHGHAVPEATTKYEPPPPPSHPPPPPGPTPTPTPDLVHDDTKIQYGPPKTEYTPPTIEYKTYVPPPIHHQHHEQPYHHHPHLVHGKVHESHHVVLPEHPKSPEYLHVYEQQHHKKEPHYYHEEGYRKKYKKPLKPTLTPIIRSEEPDEYLDPYNYKHHHPEQAPYYKHEKEHYHPYQHKHPYEHHPVIDYVPEVISQVFFLIIMRRTKIRILDERF